MRIPTPSIFLNYVLCRERSHREISYMYNYIVV